MCLLTHCRSKFQNFYHFFSFCRIVTTSEAHLIDLDLLGYESNLEKTETVLICMTLAHLTDLLMPHGRQSISESQL
jgi:hypothetical protein